MQLQFDMARNFFPLFAAYSSKPENYFKEYVCKDDSKLRICCIYYTHTHTHTHTQLFHGSLDFVWDNPGEPVSEETFTHSTLTPTVVISHPLSASSIHCDPWHPPCSIYVPDSLFPQSLSKFSLIYLLAWHPLLHTPYISSPNHCIYYSIF